MSFYENYIIATTKITRYLFHSRIQLIFKIIGNANDNLTNFLDRPHNFLHQNAINIEVWRPLLLIFKIEMEIFSEQNSSWTSRNVEKATWCSIPKWNYIISYTKDVTYRTSNFKLYCKTVQVWWWSLPE